MSPALEGGCLCGSVRYRLRGATRNHCFCHCTSCRRATGAPFVAWITTATADFEILAGEISWHASSAAARRGFCSRCGTALTYQQQGARDELDVAIASLDEPARVTPGWHIWVAEKLPWVVLGDGLPTFDGWRADG